MSSDGLSAKSRIYRDLLAQIQEGGFESKPLPSENELKIAYDCSRGTVRAALMELEKGGFIHVTSTKQRVLTDPDGIGQCTYEGPSEGASWGANLIRIGRERGFEARDEKLSAPVKVQCRDILGTERLNPFLLMELLQIAGETEVFWFTRLRLAGSLPLVIQLTVIPSSYLKRRAVSGDDLRPGGLRDLFRENNVKRVSAEAWYWPTTATPDEARHLQIYNGAPLLLERRVSFGSVGGVDCVVPYEYLVTLFTDRMPIHYRNALPETRT